MTAVRGGQPTAPGFPLSQHGSSPGNRLFPLHDDRPIGDQGAPSRGLEVKVASATLLIVLLLAWVWDAPSILIYGSSVLPNEAADGGDAARQICFVIPMIILATMAVRARGPAFLRHVPFIFVPILAWCWLSVFWAIDPAASFRRVALTTIVIMSVAYAIRLLTYRQTIAILLATMTIVLIADWLAVLFFQMSVHQAGEADPGLIGDWRGIQNHKNEAGAFCALFAILLIHESLRVRSRLVGPLLILAAIVFLVGTRSKTSEGFVGIALAIGASCTAAYNNPKLRRIGVAAALCGVGAVMLDWADIQSRISLIFDDPGSLTGRVQIWPVLMNFAADHPFLGAGYGSFWAIGSASPIFDYGSGWLNVIDHSHNGYIEILIQTGAIGLGLSILGLVVLPLYRLFYQPLAEGSSRALLCSLLAFCLLRDMLETSLLNRSNPTWVVMLIVYCLIFKSSPLSMARHGTNHTVGC